MFEAWGRFVYRRRWGVLAGSLALLALSAFAVLQGGSLSQGNQGSNNLESFRAEKLISQQLSSGQPAPTSFLLIFDGRGRQATDPAFRPQVEAALAPIQHDPRVTGIETPYNAPTPAVAQAFISKNGREALVQVNLKHSGNQATSDYAALRGEIHPADLTVTATGFVPINHAFNTTLESDLRRAETVSLPVALILLLIIFGSVIAAGLPLGVGILAIVAGLAGTFALTRITDVSQYALNVVTLIGLGVAIDYSLFVVNRFRDELERGASREDALAKTVATAGRAVTFSGLTVAIGLSAMLFYQGTFLASMGAAGGIAVAGAVLYGLTFLPALLAILGPRVDLLRVPFLRRTRPPDGRGFWGRMASWVMRRPTLVLVPTLAALVVMGIPFLHIRLANGNVDELPTHVEARQGYDNLVANFPGQDQTEFPVLVQYPQGSPLTAERIGQQYDLSKRLASIPGVLRVNSMYSVDPSLDRAGYQQLYSNLSQL
ncbi:MAG: MMPL family transporter, partial [Candidatus Dormibacteraeota bacterium]|nr:MMPL family transporter [Candidatus Dormibacteraeota bacterium]